jgi:hypothetical protein
MRVTPHTFNNEEYIYFSHQVDQKSINKRCCAPINSALKILYANYTVSLNNNNITHLDKLVVYTELIAKHWGDFGMICEAVGTDVYVMSADKMVKLLCSFFGTNFADEEKFYIHTNNTYVPDISFETNTSSIFRDTY